MRELITCLITFYRYIAYCTLNFSLLSFMHDPNLLKILFVELFVFVLVFLMKIVLWVFHPHTYYSLQPNMVISFYDLWVTCVAYTLFSIKWLLNIEICLARVLLVYACYYWFLIKYLITDSTYEIRAFSYFPLKLVNTQFNRSGFH
mgnify:CR=1 FL=1